MIRTAIYIRVSSDIQAKEGDSIPAQRDALRKYIDDHEKMLFVGEYLDDGVSGTKSDRDELQRLLSDVKEGSIDLILVTKLDRLYRNIRHYLNLQDTLDKCNCNWLAIWEPIYDTTTPQGRLIINQMMSIAQFEAENTGQRIRQVQKYKVQQGEVISGTTPPGLKIVDKHLVHDENAYAVKEMFDYYMRTGNLADTARYIQQFGCFPTSKTAIKWLLQNTKYAGFFRDNPHFCEPIIDRNTFDTVQRFLSMNVKVSQKQTYVFSGLLICAECGRKMASGLYTDCRNGHKIRRYRCAKRYNTAGRLCDNAKQLYEHKLEEYLLEHIKPLVKDVVMDAKIKAKPIRDNKRRIASIDRKLNRLKDLYVNDLITLDEYKIDKERLEADKAALSLEKAPDIDHLEYLLSMDIETLYKGFNDAEKRLFWRTVIKEIRFDKQRNIDIIFL